MKKELYKRHFQSLYTAKVLMFLIFTVCVLTMFLIVSFYVTIGNAGAKEGLANGEAPVYSVYEKASITDFYYWNKNCDYKLKVVNDDNVAEEEFKNSLKEFNGALVDVRIASSLEEMITAAKEQKLTLFVSWGYRSIEKQKEMFNRVVAENAESGCTEEEMERLAAKKVSRPGCSEHSLGLAVDFNGGKDDFCETPEYSWLLENSYKYGFVLRYPKDKQSITQRPYKPWHFRYVGDKHAKIMKEQNLCLEEYVSNAINFG